MRSETIGYAKRFLRDDRGSVAVEATLYFMAFFLLCALLVDFSTVFLNKSYMERVNHSLASVVRERTVFYAGREELTQQDVNQLYNLAGVLLQDSRLAGRPYQLTIGVVFFQGADIKAVSNTQSFSSGPVSCSGSLAMTSTQITDLSPPDANGRWLPVYQVTLCVPAGESLFKRVLSGVGMPIGDIFISNAVIPR